MKTRMARNLRMVLVPLPLSAWPTGMNHHSFFCCVVFFLFLFLRGFPGQPATCEIPSPASASLWDYKHVLLPLPIDPVFKEGMLIDARETFLRMGVRSPSPGTEVYFLCVWPIPGQSLLEDVVPFLPEASSKELPNSRNQKIHSGDLQKKPSNQPWISLYFPLWLQHSSFQTHEQFS